MSNVVSLNESRAFFSQTTPVDLKELLDKALITQEASLKESTLLSARQRWPGEPDTHIALYKFYFVEADYQKAEAAVWQALNIAAASAGFTRNYKRLTTTSADWSKRGGMERLYLFSLKALGVCRLRRGRVLAAYSVLGKLCELDPGDEIGGAAYYTIARSFFYDD